MNCDPIARWYRWLEYIGFGRELERRRCAFLREVADARRILVLGEGDGRFLVRIVEQNARQDQGASIDYMDLSGRMLDLARSRVGEKVNYYKADARTVRLPAAEYDLIVTHFFLDCFEDDEATAMMERVARSAAPQSRWLISEFRQPSHGWRAVWARVWLWTMYRFFRLATGLRTTHLIDHHPLLHGHGFRLIRVETARFGLVASELWLRDGTGTTSGDTS